MADKPNRSYHSSKWYKGHPDVPRPQKTPMEVQARKSNTPSLVVFLRFVGLALILGGFALMAIPTLYWWGMPVVQIGFLAVIIEALADPVFRNKRVIRAGLVVVCLAFWGGFNYRFVFIKGKMQSKSHAMFHGSYSAGTSFGGIEWNEHLTDLRVALINPTEDDYRDADIVIQPNIAVYKAKILSGPSNCDLNKVPGGAMFAMAISKGGTTTVTMDTDLDEVQDSVGDPYAVLLTDMGYRLICDKIPSHSNVQLIFALGAADHRFTRPPHNLPSGTKQFMELFEVAGSTSAFDMFAPKPTPAWVSAKGRYTRRFRPFYDDETLYVDSGN